MVRGKMHMEEGDGTKKSTGKTLIVITELPYQTYKVGSFTAIAVLRTLFKYKTSPPIPIYILGITGGTRRADCRACRE